jgi:hypothetical protein
MDDGSEAEFGPGDVGSIPPGHDAWVVGDEPFIGIDFGDALYAKQQGESSRWLSARVEDTDAAQWQKKTAAPTLRAAASKMGGFKSSTSGIRNAPGRISVPDAKFLCDEGL